ncbi:uncharacterized protein LOC135383313 [Ornithodoros turicata]|uniref:uncharacterized protein LOC135383313 n=1 Tax=Ornithodoros turicata TaxID=34597 RepID=UPI00313959A5
MIEQASHALVARASVGRSPVMGDRRWRCIAAVLVCMDAIVSEVVALGAAGSNATTVLWNLGTGKSIRRRDTAVVFEDIDGERHQSKPPVDWPLLIGIVITILLLLLLCVLIFRLPTSKPKYRRLQPVRDCRNPSQTYTYIDLSNKDYGYPRIEGCTHNSLHSWQHHCSNPRLVSKFQNERLVDSNTVDVPAPATSSARGDTSARVTQVAATNANKQAGHRRLTDPYHPYFDRSGRQIYRISSRETIDSPTGEEPSYKRLKQVDVPEKMDAIFISSSRETLLHATSASGVTICHRQVIAEATTHRPQSSTALASGTCNTLGTSTSHGSSSVTPEAETTPTQLRVLQPEPSPQQLARDVPLSTLRPPSLIMIPPYDPISTYSTYSSSQPSAQGSASEETSIQMSSEQASTPVETGQTPTPIATKELSGKARVRREIPRAYSGAATPKSDAPSGGKMTMTPLLEQVRHTNGSSLFATSEGIPTEKSPLPGIQTPPSRKDSRGEYIVCKGEITEKTGHDRKQSGEEVPQQRKDENNQSSLLLQSRSPTAPAVLPEEPRSSWSTPTAQMNVERIHGHIDDSSKFPCRRPPPQYKAPPTALKEWEPQSLDVRQSGSRELSVPVTERVAYFDRKQTATKQAAPDISTSGSLRKPDSFSDRELLSPVKASHLKTEKWEDESPPGSTSEKPTVEFITPRRITNERLVLPIPPFGATKGTPKSPLRPLDLTNGISFERKADNRGSTEPFSLDDTTLAKAPPPNAETSISASTTEEVSTQQRDTEADNKQLTPPRTSPRSRASSLSTLDPGLNYLSFQERLSIEFFPPTTPIAAKRTSVPDTKGDQANAHDKQPVETAIQQHSDIKRKLVELQHVNVTPRLQLGEVAPRETADSMELRESYEVVEYPSPRQKSLEVYPHVAINALDDTSLRELSAPRAIEEVSQHTRQIMDMSSEALQQLESSAAPTNLQSRDRRTSILGASSTKLSSIPTQPVISEEPQSSEIRQKPSNAALSDDFVRQDEPVPHGRNRSGDYSHEHQFILPYMESLELLLEDEDTAIVLREPLHIAESPIQTLLSQTRSTAPLEKDDSVSTLNEIEIAEQQILPRTEGLEAPFPVRKDSLSERALVPVTEQLILPTERELLYPALDTLQQAKLVQERPESNFNLTSETDVNQTEGEQIQVKSASSPGDDHADVPRAHELAVLEENVREGSTVPSLPAQLEGLLSDVAMRITENKGVPREIAVSESINQLVKSIREITARRDSISAQKEVKLESSATRASSSDVRSEHQISSALKNSDKTEEERPSIQEEERPALTLLYRPSIEYLPPVSIDGSTSSDGAKEIRNEMQNTTSTWSQMNLPKVLVSQYHSPRLMSRSGVATPRSPARIDHTRVAAFEIPDTSIVPVDPQERSTMRQVALPNENDGVVASTADGMPVTSEYMSPNKGGNDIRQVVVESSTESASGSIKEYPSGVPGSSGGTNQVHQAQSSGAALGESMIPTTKQEVRPPTGDV